MSETGKMSGSLPLKFSAKETVCRIGVCRPGQSPLAIVSAPESYTLLHFLPGA